jgi:hypothetical protein
VSQAAQVIDLGEWRDRHVLKDALPGDPLRDGWGVLSMAGDARGFAERYIKLGLNPILLHGLNEDGSCTCGRAECGDSRGKHPVFKNWQNAPLDAGAIDAALLKNWRFNLGLRMGRQPSGLVLIAIDVDGPRSLLEPLEAESGPLPPTLTQSTGKGTHLLYTMPPGVAAPPNRVKLAPGIDIRSEGGQIVCAPSRHASGRRYQWINPIAPAELPS